MASQQTKFTVGLFMAGAITIALVAAIALGISDFFEKGKLYAMYFDQSVQGLDIDSPVKYRGLHIGRVDQINVAPDMLLIEVVVKIEGNLKPDESMVAQLRSAGITGSMFIEIDRKAPGDNLEPPKYNFNPRYAFIPTKPSKINKILTSLEEVVADVKAMDLPKLSKEVNQTLVQVNGAIKDAQVQAMSTEIRQQLSSLGQNLDKTSANLNRAMERFMDHPSRTFFGDSDAPRQLERTGGAK